MLVWMLGQSFWVGCSQMVGNAKRDSSIELPFENYYYLNSCFNDIKKIRKPPLKHTVIVPRASFTMYILFNASHSGAQPEAVEPCYPPAVIHSEAIQPSVTNLSVYHP